MYPVVFHFSWICYGIKLVKISCSTCFFLFPLFLKFLSFIFATHLVGFYWLMKVLSVVYGFECIKCGVVLKSEALEIWFSPLRLQKPNNQK